MVRPTQINACACLFEEEHGDEVKGNKGRGGGGGGGGDACHQGGLDYLYGNTTSFPESQDAG